MLNPYTPTNNDRDTSDELSIDVCPVCGMGHRRLALFARWRQCDGCGNRLFIELPGLIQMMWGICVAVSAIALFSFASSNQLRSVAVPAFFLVVGMSYFTLLYFAGLPIVLFGWGRASATELERLRDSYRQRNHTRSR